MQPPQPPQPPGASQQRQVRVELPPHLGVTYANAAIVTQTHSEIILDFVQVMPNAPNARIQSRIVMTPANAKLFVKALAENLERFEKKHGEISLPPTPPSLADELFGTIKPPDDEDEGADHG